METLYLRVSLIILNENIRAVLHGLNPVRQGAMPETLDSGSIRNPSLSSGVILRDFSPEGSGNRPQQRRVKAVSTSRQILHGLKAVQDDACG